MFRLSTLTIHLECSHLFRKLSENNWESPEVKELLPPHFHRHSEIIHKCCKCELSKIYLP